ncbi:hypothetical protein ACH42_04220 [Endozoicomonas sp. (ex Bugula neritina AB1)]|nr:hypothetical protein ACH42_04220 [Endozoicomonas sp. (ex Bugula neritina AB1)]
MTVASATDVSVKDDNGLPLRSPEKVMALERLGAMHQSRLSFMRTIIRRIMRERWQITPCKMELDNQGYGTVIYTVKTFNNLFNFVLFSNYLSDTQRNDRVIATQWDLTMALVAGEIDADYLETLRQNVPKQEAGRVDSRVLVLSRANRSARNFNYVVDQLANGQQPETTIISKVGYLYRTTAVYGSGKLGMADWEKVYTQYPDFSRPFSAEMFVCLMLRNFSLAQAEHIAQHRSPNTFKPMDKAIKRYFGIGNATGLGMAPYLINHPLLISQWVEMREVALARVKVLGKITPEVEQRFQQLLQRCKMSTEETQIEDQWQTTHNEILLKDLDRLQERTSQGFNHWSSLFDWSEDNCSVQAQELLVSVALELYPELVDELENHHSIQDCLQLDPLMPLSQLKDIFECRYQWALDIDFNDPKARSTFWYRSEEKQEPRLGVVNEDKGADRQMPLGIGYAISICYQQLCQYLEQYTDRSTARFLVDCPEFRGIVRRVQSMSQRLYGDVQCNLLDKDVLPMHLLRAKLAFFGVNKFDPKSRLWVRNTMFQGAPLLEDIGQPFNDDWFMPLAPKQKGV